MKSPRTRVGAALVAITMLVAGCGGDDTSGSDAYASEAEGDTSAGAESGAEADESEAGGSITVYSTMIPGVQERLAEAFEEETGIRVDWTREQSAAMTRRFHEEYQAGQAVADVLTMNEEQYAVDNEDMFVDLTDIKGMDAIGEEWWLTDATVRPTFAPQKIAYSKAKMEGRKIPETWEDLLNPDFKGQILFGDPRTNPELSAKSWSAVLDSHGEDFLKQLAGMDLVIVPSSTPGMEDLAAGNGEILVPSYDMNLLAYEDAGAPIGLTVPFEPVVGLTFFAQIPENAPNLEGARRWIEFLFSPKGQELINQGGIGVSPLPDIPGALPMPDEIVSPPAAESLERMDQILDLLEIE